MKAIKTNLFNNKETTSLVEGLGVLENNLNTLKKLDSGSVRLSNDAILQFQLDMEKTESLPLLKAENGEAFALFWNDLYEMYLYICKINSLIISFYDKTAYVEDAVNYSKFISIEYDEISTLRIILSRFLSGKPLTKSLLEANSKAYVSFRRELFRVSAEQDASSYNSFHGDILSLLNKINDLNKYLLGKLSDIYKIAADADENIYEILEETEKACSKTKYVFNTLLNANKY